MMGIKVPHQILSRANQTIHHLAMMSLVPLAQDYKALTVSLSPIPQLPPFVFPPLSFNFFQKYVRYLFPAP